MARTKGSLNKNKDDSEGTPEQLETPEEDLKKEKATDSKSPTDHEADLGTEGEIKRLEDLNGIGPITAQKLRDFGYSVVGIATGRADEIAAEMKVTYTVAKGWVMQA